MICINRERFYTLQGELTDTAFAKRLGVSRSQLWRIKNGHCAVGSDFMEKFMIAYPDRLLNEYFFVKFVP